jgi:hypothetical protein
MTNSLTHNNTLRPAFDVTSTVQLKNAIYLSGALAPRGLKFKTELGYCLTPTNTEAY